MIYPLLGFFGFTQSGPKLPQFYTDYYSQEDRLKAIAEIIQRLIAWDELTLEKVNEIAEIVNQLDPDDIAELVLRVDALEVAVAAVVSDLGETNDTVTALQALVTTLQDSIAALEASQASQDAEISSLDARVTVNESAITALEGSQSAQDTEISALETSLASTNSDLSALETTVGGLESSVTGAVDDANAALAEVATYDARITTLETTVGTLETDVDAAVAEAGAASATVAGYDSRLTAVETTSAANESDIDALEGEVSTLSTSVSDLTTDVSDAVADVAAMNSRVTTLEGSQATQDTEISALETSVAANSTAISRNSTAITALDTRVSTNESDISALESTVTSVSATASAADTRSTINQTAIATINTDLASVDSQITALDTRVSANETAISEAEADISALETAVAALGFHYDKGSGLIAIDADTGDSVYLPISFPFKSSTETFTYKKTTRTDPVPVAGAIHYITNADGSDGLLYLYTESAGLSSLGQESVDNLTWTYTGTPPSGIFIPLCNGTPEWNEKLLVPASGQAIRTWYDASATDATSLSDLPLGTYFTTITGAGVSPVDSYYPTSFFMEMGVWYVPKKVSIVSVVQEGVEDPMGPPGNSTDMEIGQLFELYVKKSNDYGPPPQVVVSGTAGWTSYSSTYTLTSIESKVIMLIEGLRLP